MKGKTIAVGILACTLALGFSLASYAGEPSPIQLPKPQMEGGKPLMQALKDRMSTRTFSAEKLSSQTLSNLLWAAFGVNRPDSGRRTAPSAKNWQEIDVYVAMPEGLYLYDAKGNLLVPISGKDLRALTGAQAYVKDAALNLVYVADFSKVDQAGSLDKEFISAADAGFISENVYLFCASEGLGTVVRAMIDRDALGKEMKLRPDQKIMFAQSVGYPAK